MAPDDSILLHWPGEGVFEASGLTVDWARESNAQMAMRVDYRLEQALSGPVMMGMACGKGCSVEFPLDISAAEVSRWTTRTIKLRCFEDLGLDLRNIDKPFYLYSAGGNKLSISFIGLETSVGGTTC